MALTKNTPRIIELGDYNDLPVEAGGLILQGAAVGVAASGFARELTTADTFAGFADGMANNRQGAAGEINVRTRKRGHVVLDVAGQLSVGTPVYALGNDQYSSAGTLKIGSIQRVQADGRAVVRFEIADKGAAQVNVNPDNGSIPSLVTTEGSANLRALSSSGIRAYGRGRQTGVTPTFDGRSWQFGAQVEGPYNAVQFCYTNDLATPVTIGRMICMASDNITSQSPSGTPVDVSFGGLTTNMIMAAAISPRVDAANPGRATDTWSDIIPLESIPMADGSSYPALFRRAFVAAGPMSLSSGGHNFSTALKTSARPICKGRYILTGNKVGDFVTSDRGSFAAGVSTSELALFMKYRVFHLSRTVTNGLYVADSLGAGSGKGVADPNFLGAAYMACANISKPGFEVYLDNESIPSTTTAHFLQRLEDLLATTPTKYDFVILHAHSPNDGTPSAQIIAAEKFRLARQIDLCQKHGAVPIICNSMPGDYWAWNAATDNLRKGLRDMVNSMAQKGCLIVDDDGAVSNQATPARFITGYTDDLAHPNVAGDNARVAGFERAIRMARFNH